jgi:hypothetical protein
VRIFLESRTIKKVKYNGGRRKKREREGGGYLDMN